MEKSKKKIVCSCGKRLAMHENDVIWLWCKNCKHEVPYRITITNGGLPVLVRME